MSPKKKPKSFKHFVYEFITNIILRKKGFPAYLKHMLSDTAAKPLMNKYHNSARTFTPILLHCYFTMSREGNQAKISVKWYFPYSDTVWW